MSFWQRGQGTIFEFASVAFAPPVADAWIRKPGREMQAHRFPDSWCQRSLGRANAHPLRFVASERPFGKQRKAQRRRDTFGGAVALRDGIQRIAPGKPRSQRVAATRDLVENRIRERLPFWDGAPGDAGSGDPAYKVMSWAERCAVGTVPSPGVCKRYRASRVSSHHGSRLRSRTAQITTSVSSRV